jgi:diguanylate cyclase (GGDEF)-like protein
MLDKNRYLPPVVFTDFTLFNLPVEVGGELLPKPIEQIEQLVLNHDQSVFTLKFASLNYQVPSKNLYQYKMVGFDKDWSPPLPRNEAPYTNLSPGTYTFMVRASNNNGIFNETPASLSIVVKPPWWETWWFRALMVLAAIGLVLIFFDLRMRSIRAANYELERRVNERTHELQSAEQQLISVNTELQSRLEAITKLEQEVREQAIHDALTGLYNRHYLSEMLETELSRAKRYDYSIAFVLIDLDHFKDINDTFGHQAGDVALKAAAQIIQSQTRRSDIACRYGGEEFLVVMIDMTSEDAAKRAEQIRSDIEKLKVAHGGHDIRMRLPLARPSTHSMERTVMRCSVWWTAFYTRQRARDAIES